MRKIKLDLRQLTQAHIDQAMPHRGECSYSSPCIIGALMTDEDREWLRSQEVDETSADQCSIGVLVNHHMVEFAEPEQVCLAESIQNAFDLSKDPHLARLLREVNPGLRISEDA